MSKPRPKSRHASWALQDAKNRFSEVINAAVRGEPQVVTRRGIETAVILAHAEYERLAGTTAPARPSFSEYLLSDAGVGGSEPFDRIRLKPRDGA